MAQKPERKTSRGGQVKAVEQPKSTWWVLPSVAAGCIGGVVFAYLHLRFGTTTPVRAAGTAVINIAIFLASYLIARRIRPKQHEGTLEALLASVVAAVPVFVIAFIGLGYEIPEMGDFGAMYIAGVWLGSAEAAEQAK